MSVLKKILKYFNGLLIYCFLAAFLTGITGFSGGEASLFSLNIKIVHAQSSDDPETSDQPTDEQETPDPNADVQEQEQTEIVPEENEISPEDATERNETQEPDEYQESTDETPQEEQQEEPEQNLQPND